MQIRPDISILLHESLSDSCNERIVLSSLDSVDKSTIDHSNIKYRIGAKVPSPVFQTYEGQYNISKYQVFSLHNTVAICRIPRELVKLLQTLIDTSNYKKSCQIAQNAIPYFIKAGIIMNSEIFAGIRYDEPLLRTLTINSNTGYRIGIHLDSWDNAPISKRANSTNRICINLGSSNRYFFFSPYSIGRINQHIKLNKQLNISEFLNIAFKVISKSPLIGIKVRPGEAYIAPTENIFHDGSTWGVHEGTWHVTWRGFISIKNLSSPDRS